MAFNVEAPEGYNAGDRIIIRFPIDVSIFNEVEHYELPWTAEVNANVANTTAEGVSAADGGWNLIGNPYFAAFRGSGLTDLAAYANFYTTIGGERYIQKRMADAVIPPVTSFFVQVERTDNVNYPFAVTDRIMDYLHYIDVEAYRPPEPPNQTAEAPRRVQGEAISNRLQGETAQAIENRFSLIDITLDDDNMGLLIGDDYTTDYEINADLVKMIAATQQAAVYSVYGNQRLAYLALPDTAIHNIPVGYILPAGEHKFKTSPNPSQGGEMVEHLYLTDHVTGTTTDLLTSDYTFTTTADEAYNESRFEISAVMSTATSLIAEGAKVQSSQKFIRNGQLYIRINGVIYNALGQIVK